eukprot:TRINITY_DN68100_c0_g1_i1.p1 TRINITY_DN68100_c0_g1~~TRINITY_DN68100_c0_g1_i1.p1  ORF type:complete len:131 (-),score=4.97 TRINITY_DN68100_c0_g1_i1:289-681(-)
MGDFLCKCFEARAGRQPTIEAPLVPGSQSRLEDDLPPGPPPTGTIDLTNKRPGGFPGPAQPPPTDTITTSTLTSISAGTVQVDLTHQRQPIPPPTTSTNTMDLTGLRDGSTASPHVNPTNSSLPDLSAER